MRMLRKRIAHGESGCQQKRKPLSGGRKQKAVGRRQKAEGRRLKAEG
jgi:hypothetical protein